MRTCAYCGKTGKMTREHLFPNWCSRLPEFDMCQRFSKKAQNKLQHIDVVIADVCAHCNNTILGPLDSYAKNVYLSLFSKPVYASQQIDIALDYNIIAKWLLKVCYNSARINNADVEIISTYKDNIISNIDIPDTILIFVATISPSIIIDGASRMPKQSVNGEITANIIRVGRFRFSNYDDKNWAFRHIFIGSFCFFLCIPNHDFPACFPQRSVIIRNVCEYFPYFVELPRTGLCKTNPPYSDVVSLQLEHMMQFPISYNLLDNDFICKFISDKRAILTISFEKEDIESQNYAGILKSLKNFTRSHEIVNGMIEKIEFGINGYENDSRELWEIPQVCAFVEKIHTQWPFWLLFQHPEGTWVSCLILCLFHNHRHKKEAFTHEQYSKIIIDLLNGLNTISHSMMIPSEVSARLSRQFPDYIKRNHSTRIFSQEVEG